MLEWKSPVKVNWRNQKKCAPKYQNITSYSVNSVKCTAHFNYRPAAQYLLEISSHLKAVICVVLLHIFTLSPGFDDPKHSNISRHTVRNSVHKTMSENIKWICSNFALIWVLHCIVSLLKRKQESQSVRYLCHMTAHSLIGYWVQSGTIPINPNSTRVESVPFFLYEFFSAAHLCLSEKTEPS